MKRILIFILLIVYSKVSAQNVTATIYAELTNVGDRGSLKINGNEVGSLGSAPPNGVPGAQYVMADVAGVLPFALSRNNTQISWITNSNAYPVDMSDLTRVRFRGALSNTGNFNIRFMVGMAAPNTPIVPSTAVCANTVLTLDSRNNWPLTGDDAYVSTRVVWQYNVQGSSEWKGLDTSVGYAYNIIPAAHIVESGLVRFRCRQKAQYADFTYYSDYSTPSVYVNILPAPPVIDTTALVVTPACYNAANGKIYLPAAAVQTSYNTIRWILRPGDVTKPCDPAAGNCGDMIDWSNGSVPVSAGITITDIEAGDYTLWVLNPGADAGNCLIPVRIKVPELAPFAAGQRSTDVSCYGGKDGSIHIQANGGSGKYVFLGDFTALPAGVYNVTVRDSVCIEEKSFDVVIKQPASPEAVLTVLQPLCGKDGAIHVITAPENTVTLYQDSVLMERFTGLPEGQYHVVTTQGSCPAWKSSTEVLNPVPPLFLHLLSSDSANCNRGGRLLISAGEGSYEYRLGNNINTTGEFSGLPAGDYTVSVRRIGCGDSLLQIITVYQQQPLTVSVDKKEISCYGLRDGILNAFVLGGEAPYSYTWQDVKSGFSWSSTNAKSTGLGAGTYRAIITDNNGCIAISDDVVLAEPAEMRIDKVDIQEARCFEDGVTVNITAVGGDGHYVQEWTLDSIFVPGKTVCESGDYVFRITDGRGCGLTTSAEIVLPPTLLFNAALSDYHGYNISCAGNNDGYAMVYATGGTGWYSYALDDSSYADSPIISHVAAGMHTFKVQDSRGCMVSKEYQFTEAAKAIEFALAGKEDVLCAGTAEGSITVTGTGSLYSIDSLHWQTSPVFDHLTAGTYRLVTKDTNNCTAVVPVDIVAKDPVISMMADVTPVSCYGLKDGHIALTFAGGDGVYTYNHLPEHLAAGEYPLSVTDGKGCKQSFSVHVPQPELLKLFVAVPPVCDGISKSKIQIDIQGGVSPYHVTPASSELAPGDYTILVTDNNDCQTQQAITVPETRVKPDVNFLVASHKNALDTLVVKEISVPVPDAVSWKYAPETIVLGTDLIRFNKPGNYWVEMTATYGDCSYILRKALTISDYDPLSLPAYNIPQHIIDTVLLSPNPNNGHFNYSIRLLRKQQMLVDIYDMNARRVYSKRFTPVIAVNDTVTLDAISGTYLLRVVTESESRDIRFIISK